MTSEKQKSLSTPLNLLSEHIGVFIQYWGFKKIHGQLWTHIYLSADPISALELGKRIGVSKALISLSIKDLLDHKLIALADSPNKKIKLYVAQPDVFEVITEVLKKRESSMLEKIERCFEALHRDAQHCSGAKDLDLDRLELLGQMIITAQVVLKNLTEFKDD